MRMYEYVRLVCATTATIRIHPPTYTPKKNSLKDIRSSRERGRKKRKKTSGVIKRKRGREKKRRRRRETERERERKKKNTNKAVLSASDVDIERTRKQRGGLSILRNGWFDIERSFLINPSSHLLSDVNQYETNQPSIEYLECSGLKELVEISILSWMFQINQKRKREEKTTTTEYIGNMSKESNHSVFIFS